MEVDLNKILAATIGEHMLYLYSSDVNKYDIQSAFSSLSKKKVIYISETDPKKVKKFLPEVEVVKPKDLKTHKNPARIIFDGESVNGNRLEHESMLSKLKVPTLCTYLTSSVNKKELEKLVSCHSNMVLVTDSTTVLSSKNLEDISLSEENIEKWVKKNLETVVLSLLLRKPMSGKDIIKTIHANFNILLSPGRLYPLLHDLSKKELVTFEYDIRDKVYKPIESEALEKIISRELSTGKFLMEKFSGMEL